MLAAMDVSHAELYEQAKRTLRQLAVDAGVAQEGKPAFVLACHECGYPFRVDLEVGMAADHARTHGLDPDEGGLHLDLVWIGAGDPPEGNPPGV